MEYSTIISFQKLEHDMRTQLVKMFNFSRGIKNREETFNLLDDDYEDYISQIKEDAKILEEDIAVFQGHFNDFCSVFEEENKNKIEELKEKQSRKRRSDSGTSIRTSIRRRI